MIFLKSFELVDESRCIKVPYPYDIFPLIGLESLEFKVPITIFYGGNGSGKTTLLNIIAEKVKLQRVSLYNRNDAFDDYVNGCAFSTEKRIPKSSTIITSDDVFNYMMNIRAVNQKIDISREELYEEYNQIKNMRRQDVVNMKLEPTAYKRNMDIIGKSSSKFVRQNLVENIREYSNGETAIRYFYEKIKENTLYLLDEPENSLSPEKQLQLAKYIEASARGCGCQFIIATHSPFLLSMNYTRIYDLDTVPVAVRKWAELENVKIYRNFFKEHEGDFNDK